MDFSLDENSAVTNSLNEYVKDFEAIVKKYPNQWFNLYNFWER
jgi:predicted LPLAT superfamily acyltransferase